MNEKLSKAMKESWARRLIEGAVSAGRSRTSEERERDNIAQQIRRAAKPRVLRRIFLTPEQTKERHAARQRARRAARTLQEKKQASLYNSAYAPVYRMANREKVNAQAAIDRKRRRARKRNAIMGCQKRVNEIYRGCRILRKRGLDVSVDHIIPLEKGGAHDAENLQIIYHEENCRKQNRIDYHPTVVFHYPTTKAA
jgi:5-methylcytosine-specific restriction endonuclease McrA